MATCLRQMMGIKPQLSGGKRHPTEAPECSESLGVQLQLLSVCCVRERDCGRVLIRRLSGVFGSVRSVEIR